MVTNIFTTNDYQYMGIALQLAEKGRCTTMPNPAVGCVLVKAEKIIGEGWHEWPGQAHAEINAIHQAGDAANGATAYITLEPCCHHGRTPPCTDAIVAAGIECVIVAMQDPNPKVAGKGIDELISKGIDVRSGLLQAQAEKLNKTFCHRMRHGRPYVICKLAMSLDGRTAMASGESKWITSESAREDVQQLRACSSSIMTGVNTVEIDDPALTVRSDSIAQKNQPVRVILDSQLGTSPNARLFDQPGRTILFTITQDDNARYNYTQHKQRQQALKQAGAEICVVDSDNGSVSLNNMLEELARQQINDVLLEAGSTLSGAMLRAGLINELIIYMAPKLMGDTARGLVSLPGLDTMDKSISLEITDIRAVGQDWRISAIPANTNQSIKKIH